MVNWEWRSEDVDTMTSLDICKPVGRSINWVGVCLFVGKCLLIWWTTNFIKGESFRTNLNTIQLILIATF